MNQRIVIASFVCVVVAAMPAFGQETFYQAQVVGDDVHVRSGSSMESYHCIMLSAPARVTVIGKRGNWLKIVPPAGCFSVIDKKYVSVDAEKAGTVTEDNVWAWAGGSPERESDFLLQKAMKKGDKIRVLATVGKYYKIVPPRGSYFWISAEHTRRLSTGGTTTPGVAGGTTATRPADTNAQKSADPVLAELQSLNKQLVAEFKKPRSKRDVPGLLAKYKGLKLGKKSDLKPHIDRTIKFLQSRIDLQKEEQVVSDLVKRTNAQHQKFLTELVKAGVGPTTGPVSSYAAKGIVTTSAIYPGSEAIARRFALRDPKAMRIRAYLRNSSGKINLASYAGSMVGVYGTTRYDRSISKQVIDVQKVVVLEKNAKLTAPPKATVSNQ